MIYGIGIDLVDIRRMQKNIDRFGDRIAEKILSKAELGEYQHTSRPAHYLAKHFAAKEAFSKAMGTGLNTVLRLKNLGISHLPSGKPGFEFNDEVRDLILNRTISSCHLSISDEADHAIAFVVLET